MSQRYLALTTARSSQGLVEEDDETRSDDDASFADPFAGSQMELIELGPSDTTKLEQTIFKFHPVITADDNASSDKSATMSTSQAVRIENTRFNHSHVTRFSKWVAAGSLVAKDSNPETVPTDAKTPKWNMPPQEACDISRDTASMYAAETSVLTPFKDAFLIQKVPEKLVRAAAWVAGIAPIISTYCNNTNPISVVQCQALMKIFQEVSAFMIVDDIPNKRHQKLLRDFKCIDNLVQVRPYDTAFNSHTKAFASFFFWTQPTVFCHP